MSEDPKFEEAADALLQGALARLIVRGLRMDVSSSGSMIKIVLTLTVPAADGMPLTTLLSAAEFTLQTAPMQMPPQPIFFAKTQHNDGEH